MFGYMTEKRAKACGFTHHGIYYGIPVWMGNLDSEYPIVCVKWGPMVVVMEAFHWIEGVIRSAHFPGDPPCFQFTVISEIE